MAGQMVPFVWYCNSSRSPFASCFRPPTLDSHRYSHPKISRVSSSSCALSIPILRCCPKIHSPTIDMIRHVFMLPQSLHFFHGRRVIRKVITALTARPVARSSLGLGYQGIKIVSIGLHCRWLYLWLGTRVAVPFLRFRDESV